ncbi:MAG: glutamate racemase, partial [Evtepia sp.]
HYPLLKKIIGTQMGEQVTLIDTGEECARSVANLLAKQELLAPPEREHGKLLYYVSDAPAGFARLASLFLGEDIEDSVEQVDIDRF